eukprot:UC1_evm1s2120
MPVAPWFHGRLDRQEAEEVLMGAGCSDGLYLVRTTSAAVDVYVLSVCRNSRIEHHPITRTAAGTDGATMYTFDKQKGEEGSRPSGASLESLVLRYTVEDSPSPGPLKKALDAASGRGAAADARLAADLAGTPASAFAQAAVEASTPVPTAEAVAVGVAVQNDKEVVGATAAAAKRTGN